MLNVDECEEMADAAIGFVLAYALERHSTDRASDDLAARGAEMVVVSSGESRLQQRRLLSVLGRARAAEWWIEIQVAGVVAPATEIRELVDQFNVSPKVANSGKPVGESLCPCCD